MIDRTANRFTRPATPCDELLRRLRAAGWTITEVANSGQKSTTYRATATKSIWRRGDQKLVGTGPRRETALRRLLALTEAFE
jgi:hypothetical protein